MGSFRIAFQGSDPQMLSRTWPTSSPTSLSTRTCAPAKSRIRGTTDFLNSELQDTKKQLEDKEAEMGRIKSTYIMDLPESKQFHLEALTTLRAQLRQSQDRISLRSAAEVVLQAMLSTSKPAVDLDLEDCRKFFAAADTNPEDGNRASPSLRSALRTELSRREKDFRRNSMS